MTKAVAIRSNTEIDQYVSEVSRYSLLSREDEQTLARRFRDEDDLDAAHSLVVANLRFVVKVAHQYRGYGLKIIDLIQEGNMGLMHAVKKFDPERGYRLISYAVWWIKAHMQNYIMRSWSLVKMGTGRVRRKLFFKMRSERSRLEQAASGADIRTDLAESLGVTMSELGDMEMRMAARDFSLDAPVGEKSSSSHVELLSAPSWDITEEIEKKEELEVLHNALDETRPALNDKESYILDNRLLSEDPNTLAEIGDIFGVSRERIRQLESRLVKKLKKSVESRIPAAAMA